ncbi:MAG: sodium:proton antiporter [Alphaproteobacteria bacterium]|nr:sodium:proton antiporter [Alphaproteobacteria bacterium]
MNPFAMTALFLALVGVAGWANARWLRLPSSVAMVLAGGAGAACILGLRAMAPGLKIADALLTIISSVDFPTAIFRYLLAFLLFAGAMQVDFNELRKRWAPILSLATVGVVASTVIVGFGLWGLAQLFHVELPLTWSFVFGSLISPTDPVAVLTAIRRGRLPQGLRAILQGEALFNDGVAIVVFTASLGVASSGGEANIPKEIAAAIWEAGGGAVLGAVAGAIVIGAIRSIDDFAVEVSLSLAAATGVYAVAQALHLSAPIAVVVAGLMVGSRQARRSMSDTTETYLRSFWKLVDEILNALLFLLLGLEMAVVTFDWGLSGLWVGAVALVLAARFLVVGPWALFFRVWRGRPTAGWILAWGGLHGAISVALALAIPAGPAKGPILSMTFAVVLFAVVVQGLTFAPLTRRLEPDRRGDD